MSKKALRPELQDQLDKLAALPDEQSGTTDIPEAPPEARLHARRPPFIGRSRNPSRSASMPMWWPGSKNTRENADTKPKSTGCCGATFQRRKPDVGIRPAGGTL